MHSCGWRDRRDVVIFSQWKNFLSPQPEKKVAELFFKNFFYFFVLRVKVGDVCKRNTDYTLNNPAVSLAFALLVPVVFEH